MRTEGRRSIFAFVEEAETGVGGAAGMKKDGTHAIVAFGILAMSTGYGKHFSIG
jgi:hypothetical protein